MHPIPKIWDKDLVIIIVFILALNNYHTVTTSLDVNSSFITKS